MPENISLILIALSALIITALVVFFVMRARNRQALIEAHQNFTSDAGDTWFSLGWADARQLRVWYEIVEPINVHVEIVNIATSATVCAGDVSLEIKRPFSAGALSLPHDLCEDAKLEPCTDYCVTITSGSETLLKERVETSNEGHEGIPTRVSFGFFSCHQPFDKEGKLREDARDMMRLARDAFEAHNIGRLLLLGDQVYTDYPPNLSLFEESYCKVAGYTAEGNIFDADDANFRDAIEQRYRSFWRFPEFRALIRQFPNAMMMDDHDIIDNWGTSVEHNNPRFGRLKSFATDGWAAYQGSRVAPHEHERRGADFSFRHGPVAGFVMDLRTEKYSDGEKIQIFSDAQFERLRAFCDEQNDAPVFLLCLTVPFLHVPNWFIDAATSLTAEDSDFADRWSNPKARHDRDRLLRFLKQHQLAHPDQKVAILSGDIHVGSLMKFTWDDNAGSFLQICSSAISNRQSETAVTLANLMPGYNYNMEIDGARLEAEMADIEGTNPWGGLNVGVLDIEQNGDEWTICARIIAMTDDRDGWQDVSHLEI